MDCHIVINGRRRVQSSVTSQSYGTPPSHLSRRYITPRTTKWQSTHRTLSPSLSFSSQREIAERFPGDNTVTNGFGRCFLYEDVARLLYEAGYPTPPDMCVPGE